MTARTGTGRLGRGAAGVALILVGIPLLLLPGPGLLLIGAGIWLLLRPPGKIRPTGKTGSSPAGRREIQTTADGAGAPVPSEGRREA
jgi:hypothetical protein